MAIHHAKDNSFKLIFGNPELFAQFLRDFLPIDILKTVTPEDIEDLSERFLPLFQDARDSDTVKRVRLKGEDSLFVIAILEHESKVNFRASFKMLQYICLVLNEYEKDAGKSTPARAAQRIFAIPSCCPLFFTTGRVSLNQSHASRAFSRPACGLLQGSPVYRNRAVYKKYRAWSISVSRGRFRLYQIF
jgi:hypothetical protein